MLSFAEAQQIIISLAASFGTETVALQDALGRVLAEPVRADRDYPPFNRATMDGYAMKYEDVRNGLSEFEVVETIFAGHASAVELRTGQCYKIMTGAALPQSADMMIQREKVTDNNGLVTVPSGDYKLMQQVSARGEDVRKDVAIANSPASCSPSLISALAALGKATVKVERLPGVSIFTTGNEVVPVGEPVSPLQIRNSNLYMFRALVQKWGIEPVLCTHINDDKNDLYDTLSKGMDGDIIIVSGGVSAGDADFVPGVLESLGVQKLFHKVAIKPGKPIWCGHVPGGVKVFALPGNPFSGLVTFTLFVETYLSACFGFTDPGALTLPLIGERYKKSILDEFFPVQINKAPLGFVPLSLNGSGDILAAIHADGIAHHPAEISMLSSQTPVYTRLFKK